MFSEKRSWKRAVIIGAISLAAGSGIGAIFGLSKLNPFITSEPQQASENYYALFDGNIGKDRARLLCNAGISGVITGYRLNIRTKFMNYVYDDAGMDGILESYTKDFSRGKGLFTRVYMKGTSDCKKAQSKYWKYMNEIETQLRKKGINTKLFLTD